MTTGTGRRRVTRAVAGGAVLAVAAIAVAAAGGASGDDAPRALGPGPVTVRLVIRDSAFTPSTVRVRPHTDVTFMVENRDFIHHELIVGGDDVHARHERGNEPWHPPVAGEVSVAPHTTATTTYSFHTPGKVLFACHLPGHFAYGMRGTVVVER